MAEIPSEVRSSEKEQAPQCGVATIEDADICRRQKRPERVNRSKKQVEAPAMPAAPTEIAEQSRRLRLRNTDAMLQLSKPQSGFGNSDRKILNCSFGIACDATVSQPTHVRERNRYFR